MQDETNLQKQPPTGQETAHVTTKVEGAHADVDNTDTGNVDESAKVVIRAFSKLSVTERVKLFDLLETAIHIDRDHTSIGRDPGTSHYEKML